MFYFSFSVPSNSKQKFLEIAKPFLSKSKPRLILAGFAYASLGGVNRIIDELSSNEWERIEKKFIIGTSQGITEPAAIQQLMSQPNMRVRMYVPGKQLTKSSLSAQPLFHAKTMLFSGGDRKPHLFYVSSANMTGAAIGYNPRNYECGQVTLIPPIKKYEEELRQFKTWWTRIWDYSILLSDRKLKAYSKLRLNFFERNPDTLSFIEPSTDIVHATHFWIEVGKASGIERHQIEFPKHLASFFGQPKKKRVDLTLVNDATTWPGRPLSYKRTSFNVDIWRLGMPTVTMGGEVIQNRVIRYSRTKIKKVFKFEISDLSSNSATAWLNECSLGGHLGQTRGAHPRRYGYV